MLATLRMHCLPGAKQGRDSEHYALVQAMAAIEDVILFIGSLMRSLVVQDETAK